MGLTSPLRRTRGKTRGRWRWVADLRVANQILLDAAEGTLPASTLRVGGCSYRRSGCWQPQGCGAYRVLGQPRFHPALPCSRTRQQGRHLRPRTVRLAHGLRQVTATGRVAALPPGLGAGRPAQRVERIRGGCRDTRVPCRQPKARPSAAGWPLPDPAAPSLSHIHAWAHPAWMAARKPTSGRALTAAGRSCPPSTTSPVRSEAQRGQCRTISGIGRPTLHPRYSATVVFVSPAARAFM